MVGEDKKSGSIGQTTCASRQLHPACTKVTVRYAHRLMGCKGISWISAWRYTEYLRRIFLGWSPLNY